MTDSCATCFYMRQKTVVRTGDSIVRTTVPVCSFSFPDTQRNHNDQTPMGLWPQVALTDWCGWFSGNGTRADAGPTGPQGPIGPTGLNGVGLDGGCTTYRVTGTTTNATPTVLLSVPIPQNTALVLDGKIKFWDTATRLTGGYVWPTLMYTRGTGVPVACGTVDINESHNLAGPVCTFILNTVSNTIDLTVTGKLLTSIGWSGLFIADTG